MLLIKPGKETGQAVGYLDDGSMVVVEHARDRIGSDESVQVTSVVTTANGRLVFGRLSGDGQVRVARRRPPGVTPSGPPTPLSVPPRT